MTDDPNVNPSGDSEEIKPDKDGKYPETVPWNQYVRTKETIGGKLEASNKEVESLKEQLKTAPNKEEFDKIKGELEEANKKLGEKDEELNKAKEATLTEKRATLVKSGIPEEKVKDMNVEQLNAALVVLEHKVAPPGPDLGGGHGGGAVPTGSPHDLAVKAYGG